MKQLLQLQVKLVTTFLFESLLLWTREEGDNRVMKGIHLLYTCLDATASKYLNG